MITIALNGFGRIGKSFLRAVMSDPQAREQLAIIAINVGPEDPTMTAYAFTYDTIMGTYPGKVTYQEGILTIDDYAITICAESDASKLPWSDLGIDWVVDATGHYTKREQAELHLQAGAHTVLITAPAKGEDITIIPGVNHDLFDAKQHTIVSLGSCTTNAIVPMLQVLHQTCDIKEGMLTTVHAMTNSQALLDVNPSAKNPRKSRAAGLNIIPTTTGAMEVLERVLPDLKGKIKGSALRVPVPIVSLAEIMAVCQQPLDIKMIHEAYANAAQTHMKNILSLSYDPLVSSDFCGNSSSVIIDTLMTTVQGSLVKVNGWYDNEWGYSCRLKDFLLYTIGH